MPYFDVSVAAVCCAMFVVAALGVRRWVRTAGRALTHSAQAERVREEDLVRPVIDADGEPAWAAPDELTWHEIVHEPVLRSVPPGRRKRHRSA